MAEAGGAARVRLFVALALPSARRAAIAGWAARTLGADEALRVLAADSLHVTLAFLGWRGADEVAAIADAALGAARQLPPPTLAPTGVAALPPRRARVLAVELDDDGGRAAGLQAALARALQDAGLYEPERRPFRPHVTVARVRRGGRPARHSPPAPPGDPFVADEVVLYRSHVGREGARYAALDAVRLRS